MKESETMMTTQTVAVGGDDIFHVSWLFFVKIRDLKMFRKALEYDPIEKSLL